jgi:hypothetical protein
MNVEIRRHAGPETMGGNGVDDDGIARPLRDEFPRPSCLTNLILQKTDQDSTYG